MDQETIRVQTRSEFVGFAGDHDVKAPGLVASSDCRLTNVAIKHQTRKKGHPCAICPLTFQLKAGCLPGLA
jgi:hypothetical protein